MTILGKFLVFVNLVFSFLAFTWAAALYVNRIDYTNTPASEGRPEGELVRREAKLKELDASFRRSVYAVHTERKALAAVETGLDARPDFRDWYEGELELVAVGAPKDAVKKAPHEIIAAKGPRKLGTKDAVGPDLAPLRPLVELVQEEKDTLAKVTEEQKTLKDLIDKDTELTEDIIGTKDAQGKIITKGLRLRLADEVIELAEVYKEHERVEPLLINAAVDAQLILQRQELLLKRIDELRLKHEGMPPRE